MDGIFWLLVCYLVLNSEIFGKWMVKYLCYFADC